MHKDDGERGMAVLILTAGRKRKNAVENIAGTSIVGAPKSKEDNEKQGRRGNEGHDAQKGRLTSPRPTLPQDQEPTCIVPHHLQAYRSSNRQQSSHIIPFVVVFTELLHLPKDNRNLSYPLFTYHGPLFPHTHIMLLQSTGPR